MTDHNQQSSCKYVQVNNPEPVFTVPQDYTPWPFSLKLMVKANGFTESFSFDIASAMSRRDGIRKRKPPFLRRRAMNALLMAMCFYYDPLSNKVLRSLREIALECGLATKSLSGEVSITGVSLDIENYCTLRLFFDLSTLAGLSRRNLPEAGIRLLFHI